MKNFVNENYFNDDFEANNIENANNREIEDIEKEYYASNRENENIINVWHPLSFNIDETYKYVPKNIIFQLFSNVLYYLIAFPILYIITKVVYDFKIEGKENLENFKGGAISISNHVLILDCAMVGLALRNRRVFYTTQEDSFKIPFIRRLIRLLRAIPIPTETKNKPHFIDALHDILSNGNLVHFYPEAALWPYYNKIRNFKTGAFRFAIKNDVPIIPMVFTFREPEGFRKLFKRKKDVTLKILEPIKYENTTSDENYRQCINDFLNITYEKMNDYSNEFYK